MKQDLSWNMLVMRRNYYIFVKQMKVYFNESKNSFCKGKTQT
jgi:hypothetical protein